MLPSVSKFSRLTIALVLLTIPSCESTTSSNGANPPVGQPELTCTYYGNAVASFYIDLPGAISAVECGVLINGDTTQQGKFTGTASLYISRSYFDPPHSTGTATIPLTGIRQGTYSATAYVKRDGITTYSTAMTFVETNDFSPWSQIANPPKNFFPDFSFSSGANSYFGMRDSGGTALLEYVGATNAWSVATHWPYDYYSVVVVGQKCYAMGSTHFLSFDPLINTTSTLAFGPVYYTYPKFCFSDGVSIYYTFVHAGRDTEINLWRYVPPTHQWQQLKNPPFGTSAASVQAGCVFVQGMAYAFLPDTLWEYDVAQDSWKGRFVDNIPDTYVYSMFGTDSSSFHILCGRTIYSFTPASLAWKPIVDFPSALCSSAFKDDGRNFFLWTTNPHSFAWRYSL